MTATATYTLAETTTNRRFKVVGTGATAVLAQGEADAKLAMTVGTIISAQLSEPIAAPGTPATGVFSDAVLKLSRGAAYPAHTIHLDNVTVAIALAGSKGKVDIADPLVTAFASAYRDGDGNGGYTPIDGFFVA